MGIWNIMKSRKVFQKKKKILQKLINEKVNKSHIMMVGPNETNHPLHHRAHRKETNTQDQAENVLQIEHHTKGGIQDHLHQLHQVQALRHRLPQVHHKEGEVLLTIHQIKCLVVIHAMTRIIKNHAPNVNGFFSDSSLNLCREM